MMIKYFLSTIIAISCINIQASFLPRLRNSAINFTSGLKYRLLPHQKVKQSLSQQTKARAQIFSKTSKSTQNKQQFRNPKVVQNSIGIQVTTVFAAIGLIAGMKLMFEGYSMNKACRKGNIQKINNLIAQDKTNIEKKYSGITPLIAAAKAGQLEAVKLLVSKGANINAKDKYGNTAFVYVVQANNKEMISYLADHGADVNIVDANNETPLIRAVQSEKLEIATLLIDKKANLEAHDRNKQTLLLWAAQKGKLDVLKLLADKGANIEAQDTQGNTPLLLATAYGHKNIMLELLRRNANSLAKNNKNETAWKLSHKNNDGLTDVIYAHQFNTLQNQNDQKVQKEESVNQTAQKAEIEEFWQAHKKREVADRTGASIFANIIKNTQILWAAKHGKLLFLKLLFSQGANLEARDAKGNTPLILAASRGNKEAVRELLKHNANIHATNNNGQTAWKLSYKNNDGIADLIYAHQLQQKEARHKAEIAAIEQELAAKPKSGQSKKTEQEVESIVITYKK